MGILTHTALKQVLELEGNFRRDCDLIELVIPTTATLP